MSTPGTSRIERNIRTILPCSNTSTTPSSNNSIDPHIERLHRLHGSSLISSSCTLLKKNPSTYATACCIFHRFYHRESLRKYDVWSVSMACILISGKLEDDLRSIREIILCFVHLYRRRRLRLCEKEDGTEEGEEEHCSPLAASLSTEEKLNIMRHFPPMSAFGQAYKEWKDVLLKIENVILRSLGFVLYWIPDSHPHKFILYFVRVLGMEKEEEHQLAQTAWNYCNDSCLLDVCVRYEPEITACAAIYLSSREKDIFLPMQPRPWWQAFIGTDREQHLSNVCNALLALRHHPSVPDAFLKFIPSLLPDGSFNDPSSFVWMWMDQFESGSSKA